MKKILIIVLVVMMAFQAQAQFTKASLQASGLTCAMCNNAIYKALKSLPFIESVGSDIKHSSFAIVFKDKANVDIDAMKNAVEDAGFSVAAFTITGKFDNVSVANDKHVALGNDHFHFLKVNDQVLNGEQTITVVDKDFLSVKNFKRFTAATKMPCIQTGKAGTCCEKDGVGVNERVYHVTI
ncbi:MAG: heavy-metal-associated domain-containing protein [Chitinophagaceae bacterium]